MSQMTDRAATRLSADEFEPCHAPWCLKPTSTPHGHGPAYCDDDCRLAADNERARKWHNRHYTYYF